MAQNMVIAARSLGIGSCFIGAPLMVPTEFAKMFDLPKGVFPAVGLTMGYIDEDKPTRPRYPLDFTLFENKYPDLDDETVTKAMEEMDQGYLAQDYYRKGNYMIPLQGGREETFTLDNYSWTEHISRKAGQWLTSPQDLLEQLEKCGFQVAETDQ